MSCEHLHWAATSQSGDQCGTRNRGRGCEILALTSNVCIYSQTGPHDVPSLINIKGLLAFNPRLCVCECASVLVSVLVSVCECECVYV